MDYRGFITFSVRFNIYRSAHAFSIVGYKENISTNEFLVEILNPWYGGQYIGNNIKKQKQYNEFKDYEKKNYLMNRKKEKIWMKKNLINVN